MRAHLSVDGSLNVKDANYLTDHLQEELQEELPNVNLIIHIEPKKSPEKKENQN